MAGMVYYGKREDTYVLKFVDDIRCTLGVCLDRFLDQLFERNDFRSILVDLTETTAIDSTNLGVLARIAKQMRARGGPLVTLVSTDEDINATLESVGFDQVFDIRHDPDAAVAVDQPLPLTEPTEAGLAKTVLEAHHILSDLNEPNREKFRDVLEALERDQHK